MWYVIQTQTGREQELTECIERVLKGNGYRACFVIEQECVWRNAGELLEYQKPLFPSYVIADTDTPEEFFLVLKRVPKLSKLLRTDCEFWSIREEEKKLLFQMMELDECLVRRSFVTLDEDGNILTAQGPLSFFLDKIVRKRIRKRIVTVEADAMFNSALIYELAVLKQYVEPLLFGIPKDCPEYTEAKRLLKFLDYFIGVSSEDIPKNSILREFIGGSCLDV